MDITPFFKSLVDNNDTAIVICNLEHKIIYMNAMAIKAQEKRGGISLIGKNLLHCHNADSVKKIQEVIQYFKEDVHHNFVHTFFNEKQNKDGYMIALRDENKNLIGYYEKHEFRSKDNTPFYNFT